MSTVKHNEKLGMFARAAHESLSAYCVALGEPERGPWVEASEEVKARAVETAWLVINDPNASDDQIHYHWAAQVPQDQRALNERLFRQDEDGQWVPKLWGNIEPQLQRKPDVFRKAVLSMRDATRGSV